MKKGEKIARSNYCIVQEPLLDRHINKRVSVIISGKDGKPETYIGILKSISDEWVVLDFSEINPTWFLSEIMFRPLQLRSVWIYKNRSRDDDGEMTATEACRKLDVTS